LAALTGLADKAIRIAVTRGLFFLPREQRRGVERRLRGWSEARQLAQADGVVVSYGKSGRTWLRVMLSRYYELACGLRGERLLDFGNLHGRDRRIPRILFTHDNYLADYTGHRDSKRDYYEKKVVLLVRNPQDVAVSQFFQWKHRMRRAKKFLNDYPPHGADISIFDFAMWPSAGLVKIVDFMNLWAEELPHLKSVLVLRYEDLRADPVTQLRRVVEFLGGPTDEGCVREAVEYASIENMRERERSSGWLSGRRLRPGDRENPNSYKVRRAKVGGYRDYFDDEQVARIDQLVSARLSPAFGYGPAGAAPERAFGASPTGR
jgi:hypothetical protein